MHLEPVLAANQQLVFKAFGEAAAPLSAYSILERLQGKGIKAPLQVYRALEKLIDFGLVHRLESLNAFVVCDHHGDHAQQSRSLCHLRRLRPSFRVRRPVGSRSAEPLDHGTCLPAQAGDG